MIYYGLLLVYFWARLPLWGSDLTNLEWDFFLEQSYSDLWPQEKQRMVWALCCLVVRIL